MSYEIFDGFRNSTPLDKTKDNKKYNEQHASPSKHELLKVTDSTKIKWTGLTEVQVNDIYSVHAQYLLRRLFYLPCHYISCHFLTYGVEVSFNSFDIILQSMI